MAVNDELLSFLAQYRQEQPHEHGCLQYRLQPIYDNKVLVGFCAPKYRGRYYCLGHLYITPEYRGKGLACRVLKEFCGVHERVEWWARFDDLRSQHIAEKYLEYAECKNVYYVYRSQ